jgi:hypothetical protein
MASTETDRLAQELAKRLGDEPLTARELAQGILDSVDDPGALIGAFDDALSLLAAAGETDELDDTLWGLPPDDAQLVKARRAAQRAQREALDVVLADALTRAQAADLIGISPQAISKRHANHTLVALARGRELYFPAWQFRDGAALPGLAEAIAAYPGSPLSLSTWAVTPHPDLDGLSPAQALARRGSVQRVLAVIESISAAAW